MRPRTYLASATLLAIAALALISSPSGAWSTPNDGGEYTLDDAVTLSSGAVTGADGDYTMNEDLTVSIMDTLTVHNSTVVRASTGVRLLVEGTLRLLGEDGSPVRFTSASPTPSAGDWEGIHLGAFTRNMELGHAVIEHAEAGVDCRGVDEARLENVTIRDCRVGVNITQDSGRVGIVSCNLTDLMQYGINVQDTKDVRILKSEFSGNQMQGLECNFRFDSSTNVGTLHLEDCVMDVSFVGNVRDADTIKIDNISLECKDGIYIRSVRQIMMSVCRILSSETSFILTGAEGLLTDIRINGFSRIAASDLKITNLTIDAPGSLGLGSGNLAITNLIIRGSDDWGLWVGGDAHVHVFNGTIQESNAHDIRARTEAIIELYNVSFDTYVFDDDPSTAVIRCYQGVSARVHTPWSAPLPDVSVRVWDDAGSVDETTGTGPDGRAGPVWVRSFEANQSGTWHLEGPLHVNVSNGWLHNGSDVPANETVDITFVLDDTVPPVLHIEAPGSVDEDVRFTVSVAGSTDNDPAFPANANVTWRVTGPSTDLTLHGLLAELVLATPGDYVLNVTILDGYLNPASGQAVVHVNDTTAPSASADDLTVRYGQVAGLRARNYTDNDPDFPRNATFTWRLDVDGDPVVLTGATAGHLFEAPGNYSGVLEVTDASGNSNTTSFWVLVFDDEPPRADAGPDLTVGPGERVVLDGGGSYDNHRIARYTWTVDTDPPTELEGVEAEYNFTALGTFTVTLEVVDAEGNSDTDERIVNVTTRAPGISVSSPANGTEVRGATTVIGSVSSELPDLDLRYRVTGPNGTELVPWATVHVSEAFSFSVNLSGASPGRYVVEMVADDGYQESPLQTLELVRPADGNGGNGGEDGDDELPTVVILGVVVAIIVVVVIALAALRMRRGGS